MGLIRDKGIEEALRLCADQYGRGQVANELVEDVATREWFFGHVLAWKEQAQRVAELKESHDTLLTFTVGPLQVENAGLRIVVGNVQRVADLFGQWAEGPYTQEACRAYGTCEHQLRVALDGPKPVRDIGQEILEGVRELKKKEDE